MFFYPRYFCARVCVIILGDDAYNARLCKSSFSATQFLSTCLTVNRSLRRNFVAKMKKERKEWEAGGNLAPLFAVFLAAQS